MSRLALVVPSIGRPDALERCLLAARAQSAPFDEVVVATRARDDATTAVARAHGVTVATVEQPGVLAAMAAGVARTTSDLVAFTDDDAELTPHWSATVRSFFEDPAHQDVGGFGGRDLLYDGEVPRPTSLTTRVGQITWCGRVVGNHHRGTGGPRPVAMLKGVNAAYRRAALGLPLGLHGDGAQAHFEVAVGQHARALGYQLVYDPALTVVHRPAARLGDDQRRAPTAAAIEDSAYNVERALPRRAASARLLYVAVMGDGACPGLGRLVIALARGERVVLRRWAPSWRGTWSAWRERRAPLRFQMFGGD